jgi:hypothetical protein
MCTITMQNEGTTKMQKRKKEKDKNVTTMRRKSTITM